MSEPPQDSASRAKPPSPPSPPSPPRTTHGERTQRRSTLTSRNIRIGKHRTSVRLEPIFWDILGHVTKRENLSAHEICTQIAERAPSLPLTSAIRIFLVAYAWRAGLSSALEAVRTGKLGI